MHKLIRTTVPLVLALCFVLPSASAQDSPITKDTVIQMVKAGLPDEVIILNATKEAAGPKMSAADLIAIKAAGADDRVLKALSLPPTKAERAALAAKAAADPDNPMAEHEPGVYIYYAAENKPGGKKRLVMIDQSTPAHEELYGFSSVFDPKTTDMMFIPGTARIHSTDQHPAFYIYFPHSESGMNPSQYFLLKLKPADSEGGRETPILGVKECSRVKALSDQSIAVTSNRIRPFAYKITPNADLTYGGYAFFPLSTDSDGITAYAFAIDELDATMVTSAPSDADLSVDGTFAGKTPLTLSLYSGFHLIKVQKKGYKDWEQKVNGSDEPQTINATLEKGK